MEPAIGIHKSCENCPAKSGAHLEAHLLTSQISFEANNINTAIDLLKGTRRKRGRNALLHQGLQAAKRALEVLQQEPLITDTEAFVHETLARFNFNPWGVTEELRMDKSTIRWFVKAECKLLRAKGFDTSLLEVFERDMLAVQDKPLADSIPALTESFLQLQTKVDEHLEQLRVEGEHAEACRTLAVVLGVLGGCGAVAADTAAAASTTGAAAAILGVSLPVGVTMIDHALSELIDD
ncbi:hypothetical protein [Arthrobacter sp. A2-55]|uniref:hypothetical protein n=1 Tax=Arthrobacter sp. A2-55 TaxID=2897337 RepID=UPI0021CD8560|nr:hypothetical protein [Arthrobacter sp. A2-55]MCU6479803.1 hypothetical protein [Arthrobacter sp. A2-55]